MGVKHLFFDLGVRKVFVDCVGVCLLAVPAMSERLSAAETELKRVKGEKSVSSFPAFTFTRL